VSRLVEVRCVLIAVVGGLDFVALPGALITFSTVVCTVHLLPVLVRAASMHIVLAVCLEVL
jgi:hypothetical protein